MVWVDKDAFAFKKLMTRSASWLRDSADSPATRVMKDNLAAEIEELIDACVPGEFKSDEEL